MSENIYYDEEAELSVIGSMLENPKIIADVRKHCNDNTFYNSRYKIMAQAMFEMDTDNEPVDPVLAAGHLEKQGLLNRIGGAQTLYDIQLMTPTWENWEHYLNILKEKSVRRNVLSIGKKLMSISESQEGETSDELLAKVQTQIITVDKYKDEDVELVGEIATELYNEISQRQESKMLYATGFPEFDKITAGFQLGDLFIVAGRPSSGKTSWAAQTAIYQTIEHSTPVLFCSYEMRSKAIVTRMLTSELDLSYQQLSRDVLNQEQLKQLNGVVDIYQGVPLWITDKPHNIKELKGLVGYMKRKYDIKLVYIDFLTIIPPDRRYNSDYEQVTETVREIKRIATTYEVCIVLLSQMSRASERRNNPRPIMSDLRSSGEIEQTADIVTFLYRPDDGDGGYSNQTTLILAKQRNGPIGDFLLKMDGKKFRFM